jgi:protein-S-isoprenylcysteine O-methyltransferase Ste14
MEKAAVLVYGILSYLGFLGVFLYLIGFLANFGVPKSVDTGSAGPLAVALLVDTLLIVIFGIQHSAMARREFKSWWSRFVPDSIERSTYVLLTNAALVAFYTFWQPIDTNVWDVETPWLRSALWGVFAFGLLLVVFSTLLIDHFELFGLRQVWARLREVEYAPLGFRTPLLYRHVRHPIYVGWTIAFFATPTMSVGHLLFATGMLAYMRIAIGFEERDLMAAHSEYAEYRQRVPMLIPWIRRSRKRQQKAAAATRATSVACSSSTRP